MLLEPNIWLRLCSRFKSKRSLLYWTIVLFFSVPSRGIMFLFYCVQTLNSLLFSYKWRPYVKSVLSSAQENRWRRLFINVQWNCSKQEIYRIKNNSTLFYFFLTSFLPMREGRLEDIGVLAYCLLYMNLDEPSSHWEGPIKHLWKLLYIF